MKGNVSMRPCFAPHGHFEEQDRLVDRFIGESYPVVKDVYKHLKDISTLAKQVDDIKALYESRDALEKVGTNIGSVTFLASLDQAFYDEILNINAYLALIGKEDVVAALKNLSPYGEEIKTVSDNWEDVSKLNNEIKDSIKLTAAVSDSISLIGTQTTVDSINKVGANLSGWYKTLEVLDLGLLGTNPDLEYEITGGHIVTVADNIDAINNLNDLVESGILNLTQSALETVIEVKDSVDAAIVLVNSKANRDLDNLSETGEQKIRDVIESAKTYASVDLDNISADGVSRVTEIARAISSVIGDFKVNGPLYVDNGCELLWVTEKGGGLLPDRGASIYADDDCLYMSQSGFAGINSQGVYGPIGQYALFRSNGNHPTLPEYSFEVFLGYGDKGKSAIRAEKGSQEGDVCYSFNSPILTEDNYKKYVTCEDTALALAIEEACIAVVNESEKLTQTIE